MSDLKAIINATTGETEYVPMTPEEIADREQRQARARAIEAAEAEAIESAAAKKAAVVAALEAMPTQEDIHSAKDIAQLRDMTLKLHSVVTALAAHLGLAG